MGKLEDFEKFMKSIGVSVKYVMRGLQGLPPEEDVFSGLIDVKDEIERSRLPSLHDVYAQEYMRLLAKYGGDEWEIMGEIARLDAKLFIPLEGEQRKEAILMTRSKATPQVVIPGQALSVPEVSTKPGEEKEKGKEKG